MSQSPRQPKRQDESFDATIEARAAGLGSYRDTIEQNPHATIEPSHAKDPSAAGALAMLAGLRGDPSRGRRSLEIEKTIGEGGMGIVHLANQISVGRKVAVKTLRPDSRSDANTLRLLREAWVTGALEHPNVVPVYDVGLDEHGAPVIVLKRIEGVHWGELMNDEGRVRSQFKARDLLEWNIGILMQVCNAVHFAHSRGIVHRDLKPENVMIGEFGEVYLLDWGIAVSLRDDGTGRFPLARDAKQLAGTPCYMAPESLGDGPITERTDVFLLGAILYELVTGAPPHTGETVLQILSSILQREPAFPESAPVELVRIAKRAMAVDPDGRFESAEQVRLSLQGYLAHRDSATLSAGAERALESLKKELADTSELTPERRQRIYNAFGACRFGFREALRIWSGNEVARERFRESVVAMIEFELSSRDPRSAHVLLGELDEERPDLAERIEASRRELEEEAKRARSLEKLGQQYDSSVGKRTRSFMALLAGIIWSTFPMAALHFDNGHNTRRSLILAPIAMLGLFAVFAIWARESMTKTKFNRSVLGLVFLVLSTQVLLQIGTALLGFEEAKSAILNLFLWGTYSLALSVTLEKRLAFAGVSFYVAFVVACLRPEWRWYLFSAGNMVLTANMVWIWRPDSLRERFFPERAKGAEGSSRAVD